MFRLIHRLFTGYQHGDKSTVDVLQSRVHDLHTRMNRLELDLEATNERHASTYEQLHKLRGQFHGTQTGKGRGARVDEIVKGDKDALRRLVGITAGRPFAHTTGQQDES